jgi:hypothetical protein
MLKVEVAMPLAERSSATQNYCAYRCWWLTLPSIFLLWNLNSLFQLEPEAS